MPKHADFELKYQFSPDPWGTARLGGYYAALLTLITRFRSHFSQVLDVGCGEAMFTADLAKISDKVWGVDISATAIERARLRLPSGAFVVADIRSLSNVDLPIGAFDLVVASEVLPYLTWEEACQALRTLGNFLSRDGLVCITSKCCGGDYFEPRELRALVSSTFKVVGSSTWDDHLFLMSALPDNRRSVDPTILSSARASFLARSYPTCPSVATLSESQRSRVEEIASCILRYRRRASPLRILDVGCGTGARVTFPLSNLLPKGEFSIIGLDRDRPSIGRAREMAKAHGIADLDFVCAELGEFSGEFDYVVCVDVLDTQADPVAFLSDVLLRMGRDAVLILSVANRLRSGPARHRLRHWLFGLTKALPSSLRHRIRLMHGRIRTHQRPRTDPNLVSTLAPGDSARGFRPSELLRILREVNVDGDSIELLSIVTPTRTGRRRISGAGGTLSSVASGWLVVLRRRGADRQVVAPQGG